MSISSQRYRSYNFYNKARLRGGRGFTLIELLVVMAIMVIVTGVLLVRQSKFDSSTLLRSLGYSVALSVRQAQVYGTSVFGTTTISSAYCNTGTYVNGACFARGYGIYVNWGSGNPTSYTLFADFNNNGTYDPGEDVKVYSLGQGYAISKICATTGGTQYCSNGGGITWLSISFRRPNPEACFTTNDPLSRGWSTACAVGATAAFATSSIQIQAAADPNSSRSIFINSTGQISVGNAGS